ncbi:MAG: sensor histidine kinase, partial [Rhodospirillaceae bacterium]
YRSTVSRWIVPVPMFDPQTGSRIGNRGTAKDITSTEEASAALNRQHAFRKVLMDAIPLPVFVKDRAGRYIAVNKAFCEAAGRPSEQILYETMESLLPPDEIEIYQDVEQEILERGGSRYLELSTRFADGKKHQIVLAMSRYGEGQRTSGLIGVVTDVTALRVTEKDLQSSIDALTRSNSELRHFTEVAAHDLQEPVRTVVSYCQLIERTLGNYPDPHLQEYLHFAMSGARRMRDLVNDLTLYASVDRTHKQPHRLDLALIALQAAEDLQRKIQDPDVQITVRKPLPDAFGDQIEIKQVFRHLFENAWKFRNPDRPVQVTVSASAAQPSALALEQAAGSAQDGLEGEGAMVTIAVQDNGIGMAEADLERIFSLFRRLHGQDRFPGTGIGLAVCRKIVERSGGRIWAESLGDQGSRLCFTLPLSRGRAQAPSPLPLAGFSTE